MRTTLCRIDRKGRVRLPTSFLDALEGEEVIYLTLQDHELRLTPRRQSFREEFSRVADAPPDACDL